MRQLLLKYFLFFISVISFSQLKAEVEIPNLNNQAVIDLADIIPANQERAFNQELIAFSDSTGSQIVVFTFNDLNGDYIENVGIKAAEKWKIGRKNIDDGVILLVAKNDRQVRIEVGYGLEGALTDALSKRIIENVIVPEFKNGQFYLGLYEATQIIKSVILGEDLPDYIKGSNSGADGSAQVVGFVFLFFITLFISIIFTGFVKNKILAGVITALIGLVIGFIFFALIKGVLVGIIVGLLRMTMNFKDKGGGSGRSGGYRGGWYVGGGSSSFGGGGFGGGFSGGGGSFGGGGASGSW